MIHQNQDCLNEYRYCHPPLKLHIETRVEEKSYKSDSSESMVIEKLPLSLISELYKGFSSILNIIFQTTYLKFFH